MELARSCQGELWECRREADKFLNAVDKRFSKERAVARLMRLECLCWEQKLDDAVQEAKKFVIEEKQNVREVATAYAYLAGIYYLKGNYAQAKTALEQVIKMNIPDGEQWKFRYNTWNLKLRAAGTGKRFAKETQNIADQEYWQNIINDINKTYKK